MTFGKEKDFKNVNLEGGHDCEKRLPEVDFNFPMISIFKIQLLCQMAEISVNDPLAQMRSFHLT